MEFPLIFGQIRWIFEITDFSFAYAHYRMRNNAVSLRFEWKFEFESYSSNVFFFSVIIHLLS